MMSTATVNSQEVETVAVVDKQLTLNVMLVEWLVKLQDQIKKQERLIEEQLWVG